ncbi:ABC transporter substrate-binding protein [Cohnella hongkongensis]|uniref:ABC transporter substrate-binding protein n=1 Tax=Cohnella hongkongensis TaxID=178337 RepID=A0ABV9FBD4_9BACL
MGGQSRVRKLAVILVSALLLGACGGESGFGGGANGRTGGQESGDDPAAPGSEQAVRDPDIGEEVRLRMLLIGDKPADYEEVFGRLNLLLKDKINAAVEVEFLDWSDWSQKYPLKFAAKESFDIAYTANWAFYYDQALKGGFLELTGDLLARYAPRTWERMPDIAWRQAKVEGKLYMVPNNDQEMTDKAVIIRDDLRKKYHLEPVSDPETFAAYLKAVGTGEPGISAFGAKPADGWKWHELDQILLEQQNEWNLVDYSIPFAYRLDDPEGRVFNVYETPEFRELIAYYKDLADRSGWSKNVITNKTDVWQSMLAGKTGSYAQNLRTLALNLVEMRRDRPEFEGAIADLTPGKGKIGSISTQNGLAIHAESKHVERSLMLIDLLQNDKEIHDLAMYGIAGKHYEPVGEDKMRSGPYAANYASFSSWGWDSPLNRTDADFPEEAAAIHDRWLDERVHFPLETFVFNDAGVKPEVANVGNVMLRYAIPLEYGLIQDLDKGRDELIRQLKTAGIEKIGRELQAQIDAFLSMQL